MNFYRVLHECQNGNCFYCNQPMPYSDMTRDHFLPQSAGYKYCKGNMVLAHEECNSVKSSHTPTYIECIEFILLWRCAATKKPKAAPHPVWDDFIEQMTFIERFNKIFGLSFIYPEGQICHEQVRPSRS